MSATKSGTISHVYRQFLMHVPRAKMKGCQFPNNHDNSVIMYWTDCAETSYARRHLLGNVFPCVTVWVLLHVRTCKGRSQILRTAEPIALKFGAAFETGRA